MLADELYSRSAVRPPGAEPPHPLLQQVLYLLFVGRGVRVGPGNFALLVDQEIVGHASTA